MVNTKQLRFFNEVARHSSFSKAAEVCCVTQPTLSNSIAMLEESLEGKLFNRSTRQVSLTALGRYLLPLADAVLTAQEEFIEKAKSFQNPQHKLLRIGLSPLIDMQLLDDILKPFRNQHPDIEVFFKECYMGDLNKRMIDETIDFAIMPKRESYAQFKTIPLYAEPLYFLPCEHHGDSDKIKDQTSVMLSEIADESIIITAGGCGLRDAIEHLFATEGLDLTEYRGNAVSYKVIEDWASLGIGAGILPQSKLSTENRKGLPLLQNKKTKAIIEYEISFPRHIKSTEHIHAFAKHLKEVAPQIIQGRVA